MKKVICLLLACVLFTAISQAGIRRVNNNAGVSCPFCYTTVQAAHDAAAIGDTLYVEPSTTAYGALSMNKRLVIIGNGYFLGSLASNGNPNLQANINHSIINGIVFTPGSSNSVVMGIMSNTTVYVGQSGPVSNIIFRRNYVTGTVQLLDCSNVMILQNYLTGYVTSGGGEIASGFVINNNIMGGGIAMGSEDFGVFNNNVLGFNSGQLQVYNSTVWNNIMINNNFGTNVPGSDLRNNIGNTTQFGTGNGNQIDVTMSTVFEDPTDASSLFSQDSRFLLKAGSPAIGAANGGGDCGIFGTANGSPYVLSGIPNIPSIYKLTAPATTNTNLLNVTISTRTNQ